MSPSSPSPPPLYICSLDRPLYPLQTHSRFIAESHALHASNYSIFPPLSLWEEGVPYKRRLQEEEEDKLLLQRRQLSKVWCSHSIEGRREDEREGKRHWHGGHAQTTSASFSGFLYTPLLAPVSNPGIATCSCQISGNLHPLSAEADVLCKSFPRSGLRVDGRNHQRSCFVCGVPLAVTRQQRYVMFVR